MGTIMLSHSLKTDLTPNILYQQYKLVCPEKMNVFLYFKEGPKSGTEVSIYFTETRPRQQTLPAPTAKKLYII